VDSQGPGFRVFYGFLDSFVSDRFIFVTVDLQKWNTFV
jgi:hypothetical protein